MSNTYLKSGLQYKISIIKDAIKVIKFSGSFTIQNFGKISEYIYDEFNNCQCKMIVLDFKELIFITSFAIGKILSFYKTTKKNNVEFVLINLSQQSLTVFKMTKLDKLFVILKDIEEVENYYKEKYGDFAVQNNQGIFSNISKNDFLAYQFHLINILGPIRYNIEEKPSEKSNMFRPIIKIVTDSIVQGKIASNIFLEKEVYAEAIKFEDTEREITQHKNIISWIFLEDLIENYDLEKIFKKIEILRGYEKKNAIIKSPIFLILNIELNPSILRRFTSNEVNLLNLTSHDISTKLLQTIFSYLKSKETFDFFLSSNINITIDDENMNIIMLNNLNNDDIEYLQSFFNNELMKSWLEKLFSINIKFRNTTNLSDEFLDFFTEFYNVYSEKTIIYLPGRVKNVIEQIQNKVKKGSINLL